MTIRNAWLIYNSSLQSEKFLDAAFRLKAAAAKRQIELTLLANDELLSSTDGVLIPENLPEEPSFILAADKDILLLRQLEEAGHTVINSSRAVQCCDDKRWMHAALARAGIRQPKTIFAPMVYKGIGRSSVDYVKKAGRVLGFPLVVKEAFGSFGRQVYWIRSEEELLSKTEELDDAPHLYQEAIMESYGVDIRLNVVGGRAVAGMKRTSTGDFRANMTLGGSAVPYDWSTEEEDLAVTAARACGAEFAGVDLFVTAAGPILCEVNSNPHLRTMEETTGVSVEDKMMTYLSEERSFS
ncbi:ATP-grasp domain-containing protein [Alkalicoccus urumqiensis]|uniref:RimK family alpha-L-glutamate ligase n=1 Tax=Alkalicoccus urumqiensis TaxID=1548213 RepID=A0A2P6MF46_ALKUR|nr:RimK family alpha-L-glutamate ligase [Alkalicoccus urumqiensis]PRO64906.1 RimK family alpha-L-glutamate ligase [Alkalicoccus urumqiensis]